MKKQWSSLVEIFIWLVVIGVMGLVFIMGLQSSRVSGGEKARIENEKRAPAMGDPRRNYAQ